MASLEHLDFLLGEALENIMEAAREVRELHSADTKERLKLLGTATFQLWQIRDAIYRLNPELKRDFVREYEQDKERYEELMKSVNAAVQAERGSHPETAMKLYEQLMRTSRFGFFRMVAEAGLYRISKTLGLLTFVGTLSHFH